MTVRVRVPSRTPPSGAVIMFGATDQCPSGVVVARAPSRIKCQERRKDNAFQTSRLHVQSRTGYSADKGSADSSGQSHQGKARLDRHPAQW